MSRPRRSALPDNLDPLVDTLSNVVGILVIVIALTQLELGEAVQRVAREVAERVGVPPAESVAPPEAPPAPDPALDARREALRARGIESLPAARRTLERVVATLEPGARGKSTAGGGAPALSPRARAALEARVSAAREALAAEKTSAAHRREYAASLEKVPKRLVARLPDPGLVEGREAWILVRYGRVYPVEREALFEKGRQAVTKIVPDGATRTLRPDELASVAHYLRKSDVGLGPHRWTLETDPALHMVLRWRTRDGGIERSRIDDDPGFAAWLARHDPAAEAIRFHVWSDSFEAYLDARARVEAAGFRAGWRGHEADEELEIGLRFGLPEPEVRPREVD
ncbi:MAG: hypothetical protein U0900_02470 [Myxococcota bacterium]